MYTQHVNRTHGRVGHVFQGRYKAILVEKDAYLLEWSRYVVLNPVRAGVGLPSIWDDLRSRIYLGDDAFLERMQRLIDDKIGEIPRMQRRPLARPLNQYLTQYVDKHAGMAAAGRSMHLCIYASMHLVTIQCRSLLKLSTCTTQP